MKFSTILLVIVLVIMAVFAALNWDGILAPSEVSLGLGTVELPLGLIMLGLTALVIVIFLAILTRLQGAALGQAHRYSRELETERKLAEEAEASRFTELRSYLEAELSSQAAVNADAASSVLDRIEQLEVSLRTSVEQSGNTLAAYIGEMDDRLGRGGGAAEVAYEAEVAEAAYEANEPDEV